MTTGNHIVRDACTREVFLECLDSNPGSGPGDAVGVVRSDIVTIDEVCMRSAFRRDDVTGLKRGVVLDDDIGRTIEQLKEPPSPPGAPDVLEQIIADQAALGLLTGPIVVLAEDVDA